MSANLYWSTSFTDGVVTGRILFKKGTCPHCEQEARLLQVERVTLPAGVDPTTKFIFFGMYSVREEENQINPHPTIGLTCGCYAKGHRQIAYVLAKRAARKK